jgi:hypothetical protein
MVSLALAGGCASLQEPAEEAHSGSDLPDGQPLGFDANPAHEVEDWIGPEEPDDPPAERTAQHPDKRRHHDKPREEQDSDCDLFQLSMPLPSPKVLLCDCPGDAELWRARVKADSPLVPTMTALHFALAVVRHVLGTRAGGDVALGWAVADCVADIGIDVVVPPEPSQRRVLPATFQPSSPPRTAISVTCPHLASPWV